MPLLRRSNTAASTSKSPNTALAHSPIRANTVGGSGDAIWVSITPSWRSEEHTSELQSLMRISYAVFCLNKKITPTLHSYPIIVHTNQHHLLILHSSFTDKPLHYSSHIPSLLLS